MMHYGDVKFILGIQVCLPFKTPLTPQYVFRRMADID